MINSEDSQTIQLTSKTINRMVITISQIAITLNLVTKIVQNEQLEILIMCAATTQNSYQY